MKFLKFLGIVSILSSVVLASQQQQYPVFQAQAGAVPQQQNIQVQQQQQRNFQQSANQAATSSLNDMANVPSKKNEKNEFLQFYTRQGGEITPTVYYQSGNSLVKKNISQDKLDKAVIVFFGDWCPHCHNFMTSFANAKNLEPLVKYGINVIFINIPSIDKLRNWEEPTVDEFNAVENKVSSYIKPDGVGVSLTDTVSVTLLGDVATLQKAGIDGLPVVVAVKDGKEYYRGVGENCITKLRFTDLDTLMNFLDIWNDKAIKEQAKEEDGPRTDMAKEDSKDKKSKIKNKKSKKSSLKGASAKNKKRSHTKVNLSKAKEATELLNMAFGSKTKFCRLR